MVRFSDLAWTDKGQRAGPFASQSAVFSTVQSPDEKDSSPQKDVFVEEVVDEKSRKKLYEDAYYYLGKVFEAVKHRKRFAIEPGVRIIREMVETDPARDSLFIKAIHHDDRFNFLLTKSVNISIYAIRLGKKLGFDKQRLLELGMAGLFHDVGMWVIPDEILYKKGALTDKEFSLVKQHSDFGYQILRSFEDRFPFLAECALQVHERYDGSGYPNGLRGDEIQEFAQIVGLADTYEALSHSRAHREKYNHFNAIKRIIKTGKHQFQPLHLKALLTAFSIFPLYSYVRLNSNAIGKVIETYPEQPMRPKLQIVCDSQGQKVLTERIANLPENSLLYIVDSVSEEDVGCLVNGSSSPEQDRKKSETGARIPEAKKAVTKRNRSTERPLSGEEKSWTHSAVMIGAIVTLALILLGIFWQFHGQDKPDVEDSTAISKFVVRKNIPHEIFKEPEVDTESAVPTTETGGEPTVPLKMEIEKGSGKVEDTVKAEGELPAPVMVQPDSIEIKAESLLASKVAEEEVTDISIEAESASETMAESPSALEEKPIEQPDTVSLQYEKSYPFSILMASFKRVKDAQNALEIYGRQGLRPYWVKVDLEEDGIWYRVFTGWFKNLGQAEGVLLGKGIRNAQIKRTPYANHIGASDNDAEIEQMEEEVLSKGWDSYAIESSDGFVHLFVGAFYTEAGAQTQQVLLEEAGIVNQVVER